MISSGPPFGYDLDHGGLGNDLIFGDGRGDAICGNIAGDPSQPGGNDFMPGDTDQNQNAPSFREWPGLTDSSEPKDLGEMSGPNKMDQ